MSDCVLHHLPGLSSVMQCRDITSWEKDELERRGRDLKVHKVGKMKLYYRRDEFHTASDAEQIFSI